MPSQTIVAGQGLGVSAPALKPPARTDRGRPSTGPDRKSPHSARMAGSPAGGVWMIKHDRLFRHFIADARCRRYADVVEIKAGTGGGPSWSARRPPTRRFPARTGVCNVAHRVPHALSRDPARATPEPRPGSSTCCSSSGRTRYAAWFGGPGKRGCVDETLVLPGVGAAGARRGPEATPCSLLPAGEDVCRERVGEVAA